MSSTNSDKKMNGKAILTDVTKCIGCERCVQGCVEQNQLPADIPAKFKVGDGLSGARFTSIVETPGSEAETSRFVRRQCMHCDDPGCVAACLVGALVKREDGPVVYDADMCIGCRYCMLGCPFSIPRYEYDEQLPYIKKCKMDETCRVAGGGPACTTSCPTGATVFGPREDLIAEAKRRIAEHPELYEDHVWGEHEFGGTSVIYISDVPLGDVLHIPTEAEFKARAVPSLATDSIPHLVHNWVMVTPFQFLGGLVGLGGLAFLRRRSKLMEEAAREAAGEQGGAE
jgi:formate dehydrogenase iron-sulfur subunit